MASATPRRRSALPISALIHTEDNTAVLLSAGSEGLTHTLPSSPVSFEVPQKSSRNQVSETPPVASPQLFWSISMPKIPQDAGTNTSPRDTSLPFSLPSREVPSIQRFSTSVSASSPCVVHANEVDTATFPIRKNHFRLGLTSSMPPTVYPFKQRRGILSSRSDRTLKNPWTPAETAQLGLLVEEYGAGQWAKIAGHIPGRSGKQVRERWKNHLDPTLKKTSWTLAEDATILRLYEIVGKRWSTIARQLPGRSDNNVKNRFYCSLRPKMLGHEKAMMG